MSWLSPLPPSGHLRCKWGARSTTTPANTQHCVTPVKPKGLAMLCIDRRSYDRAPFGFRCLTRPAPALRRYDSLTGKATSNLGGEPALAMCAIPKVPPLWVRQHMANADPATPPDLTCPLYPSPTSLRTEMKNPAKEGPGKEGRGRARGTRGGVCKWPTAQICTISVKLYEYARGVI